jgi:hypothetical protein
MVWGNPDQLQYALFQFMYFSFEEMTDECEIEYSTHLESGNVRFVVVFKGGQTERRKTTGILKQIFGGSVGSQKLSIIVAGETIKYHRGNYGVEGTAEYMPRLYIELPHKGDGDHAGHSDS